MTRETLIVNNGSDCAIAEDLAQYITELFNSGDNHLTSIKVCINLKNKKANIYAGYEDTRRLLESGSEETTASLCEAFILWPHFQSEENTEEKWKDLSYPKRQMERALLLSQKLNQQLMIINCSDDLTCFIKNGKAHIDKV